MELFDARLEDLQRYHFGPLAPHLENFATLLSEQRYRSETGWNKIRLVADFSDWLDQKNILLKELDDSHAEVFLHKRWKEIRRSGAKATLRVLLQQLRESHVIPDAATVRARSPIALLKKGYETFLLRDRGLAQASVREYLPAAESFLAHRFPTGKVWLHKLRSQDVSAFVLDDTTTRGRCSAQLRASALRSFLGFLFQRGKIRTNLAMAVPSVAAWRLSDLPRSLAAAEVEKVLRSCDRRTKRGKRDYAILLLLARLGLRAGEVAGLQLGDLDWTAAELRIRGKGSRLDRLPLVQDVGQALAGYLQHGRPISLSRSLFIRGQAPYESITRNAVSSVAQRALARAELHPPHRGAHLFRHSLATRMLRRGASLTQIGQVLRHQHLHTTEIYAKVDLAALRSLAQPWPGGKR
jgi:site-specific recombinase XerD